MKYTVINGPAFIRQEGVELETVPSLGSVVRIPQATLAANVLAWSGLGEPERASRKLDPRCFDLVVAYLNNQRTALGLVPRISRSRHAPVTLDLHNGTVECQCGARKNIHLYQTMRRGHVFLAIDRIRSQAKAFVQAHLSCA